MAAPKKSRKSPRAQVSLVARYRSPTAFEFVQEECFDLSLGGMFIRSPAPAPAGTLIKLECDVNGGSGAIRGVARVVWLRENGSDRQPTGMGVKFVKLEAGAREAISGLLEQLGAEVEERDTLRPTAPRGPFQPTPSAPPHEAKAAAGAGPSPMSATMTTTATTASSSKPAPTSTPAISASNGSSAAQSQQAKPAAALSRGAGTDKVTPIELAAPVETARPAPKSPAPAPSPAPQKSKSKSGSKKRNAAARATPAATPMATTIPPGSPARMQLWKYGGAAVLLGAIALFVAVSQQPHSPPAEAPTPALATQGAVAPPAPPPPAAAPQVVAEPTPPVEAPPPPPKYVLDVATNPPGARVTAGANVMVAPGQLDLGALDEPLALTAESDGFEPATATIDRVGFMLEDGAMRRRIELVLTARAAPVPPETPKPEPVVVARAPEPPKAHAPARAPEEPKPKPARAAKAAEPEKPASERVARVAAARVEPKPAATPEPAPAQEAAQTPMQAAAACLTTGDNACVIRALDGKAKSPRELELLIETYRALGETAKADSWMQSYLDRFPAERRAPTYRRLLERRQGESTAAAP